MYKDVICGNHRIRGDSSGAKVLYAIEIMLLKILTRLLYIKKLIQIPTTTTTKITQKYKVKETKKNVNWYTRK